MTHKPRFDMKPLPWEDDKLRVVLFGLTGMGNAALRALLANSDYRVLCVVTRKEQAPYPYYQEEHLSDFAEREGIVVHKDINLRDAQFAALMTSLRPHLILTATYHQLIPMTVIDSAQYAINIHPSLLPKYRGATPTHWVLRNGEGKTGLTAHQLTPAMDQGPVCAQVTVPIYISETDGMLRRHLALETERLVSELMRQIKADTLTFHPQDETLATSYPKRERKQVVVEVDDIQDGSSRVLKMHNLIRSYLPFPGVRVGDAVVRDTCVEAGRWILTTDKGERSWRVPLS